MAHEITSSDKVLSVREYTWHGLEIFSPDYLSIAETKKLVHDFEVIREPVFRRTMEIDPETGFAHYDFELIKEFQLNTRTDNAAELSVVPTERVDISIQEMYDIAEVVQGESQDVRIETAGTLRGGRDAFILLRLNEPIAIKGDRNGESLSFLALQNAYDPGAAFRIQPTNVRIVCKNTSRAVDVFAEHSGLQLTFAHTKNMMERVEEAKKALAGWREDIKAWARAKEFMATQTVTNDGINWFVDQFIPEPHAALTSERVKANIETARLELISELFNPMTEGIEFTALGLFEAASSWNEHVRKAQTPLSRFKRAVLEPTNVLIQARELALEAVNV